MRQISSSPKTATDCSFWLNWVPGVERIKLNTAIWINEYLVYLLFIWKVHKILFFPMELRILSFPLLQYISIFFSSVSSTNLPWPHLTFYLIHLVFFPCANMHFAPTFDLTSVWFYPPSGQPLVHNSVCVAKYSYYWLRSLSSHRTEFCPHFIYKYCHPLVFLGGSYFSKQSAYS